MPAKTQSLITMACALALAAPAGAGELKLGGGVDHASGDYGLSEDTTIITVPLSAAYVARRWSLSVTVPFASVEGPGGIVPSATGFGSTPAPLLDSLLFGADPDEVTPGTNVSESGLGDVTAAASVVPLQTDGGLRLTLGAGVRAPTGDPERSLGTGEASGSLSAGLSQRMGRAAVYGVLGVERAFESEADGVFAGAGAEGYVSDRALIGASLSWSEASGNRLLDAAQASAYAGYDVSPRLQLRAYGAAGLTDTSPDLGAGVRLVWTAAAD